MKRPAFDPDSEAHRRFEQAARAAGLNPDERWTGGYADYEWDHVRPALAAYGIDPAGKDILEFGCNVGGSSVVLAALGARLSGIDVDPLLVPVAQANLERHGLGGDLRAVPADAPLPFADASFDLALANSVLEYVATDRLPHAIAELHRVLRPGGLLFICGTASRLTLRERHSGCWLVNYLPDWAGSFQRGLSPRRLARLLRGRFDEIGADRWIAARAAIHGHASLPVRAYALAGRLSGRSPGWFAPTIELLLRRI